MSDNRQKVAKEIEKSLEARVVQDAIRIIEPIDFAKVKLFDPSTGEITIDENTIEGQIKKRIENATSLEEALMSIYDILYRKYEGQLTFNTESLLRFYQELLECHRLFGLDKDIGVFFYYTEEDMKKRKIINVEWCDKFKEIENIDKISKLYKDVIFIPDRKYFEKQNKEES